MEEFIKGDIVVIPFPFSDLSSIKKRPAFIVSRLKGDDVILIFKQTVSFGGTIKGNCDAELVLKTVSDFYTKAFTSCILVTGDGDFGCLAEFLQNNKVIELIVSPDEKKCSILLKNKNTEITFLNEHYHKFSSEIQNKKAPDADVSA